MERRALRIARATVAALGVAVATAASAGAPAWGRRMEFAKRLVKSYDYEDLSKVVVDQLLADTSVKDDERARLYKAVAEYHVEMIEGIRGRDALPRITEHLAKAREFFDKYVDHPAVKGRRAERFEVRKRLVWIMVNLARVHARRLDDPDVSRTEQAKHRVEAVAVYKAAIKEFEGLAAEKKAEEEKAKVGAPKEKAAREKWEERYNQVRSEHAGVRIYLNDTRVELGKLLKKLGAPTKEWKPLIEMAEKDYKQMLYEFSGAEGLGQINAKYAEAIVELGPERDKEALERLKEVWDTRQSFLKHKAVPCRAMHTMASILLRQKKYDEVIDALDEMIGKRTGSGWEPGVLQLDLVGAKVTDILRNLEEGESPQQYDSKALAASFLLMVDAYAARAKAAEDAKKPGKEVQRFYRMAYEIAVGVWDARMPMDPKYVKLVEFWRKKSGAPPSLSALNVQVADALQKADRYREKEPEQAKTEYLRAARLYTEMIARTKPEPDQLRRVWENIARCYYFGGDFYRAYTVYTALSRWFRQPQPQACAYARSAIAVMQNQIELSTKGKAAADQLAFESNVLHEAYLNYEFVSGEAGAATIADARDRRKAGDFKGALERLDIVQSDAPAYPVALYEKALTYREWFLTLPKGDQKGPAGQQKLRSCLEAFQACLDFGRKKLPTLKAPEKAEERGRLLDATARGLTVYCDTLLKSYVNQPAKVIELTAGLKEMLPGIDTTPHYSFLIYNRMHAAYVLATGRDPQQAAQALPVIDETWKLIKAFKDFKYLVNACKMGAMAHNEQAKALEALAQKTKDAGERAALEQRAAAARDRGLDFYLELLEIAPHQALATYRYVLYQLDRRSHEPKSADYRRIVALAPKALELFTPDVAPADELAQVKILLATAHCRLDAWRTAIPILEEVDAFYEGGYTKRMAGYDKRKALNEKDPERYPAPKRPVRHPIQLQAREWLGRAYLETKARSKLKDVRRIYAEQATLYPRESPKHWEGLYFFCEATRLEGDCEECVKYLFRVADVMNRNPVKEGNGSQRDFLDLTRKLRKDVEAAPDAERKQRLLPIIDGILKKLGQ